MQNYWKQKEVYKKHNINSGIQSSKEVVSKLTGIDIKEHKYPEQLTDEDALLESINNLDFVLAQEKKPALDKQDALLKLAEHMGAKTGTQGTDNVPPLPPKEVRKPKGMKAKIDEIRSQRSECVADSRGKPAKAQGGVKYGEAMKKRSGSKGRDTESETKPREIKSEIGMPVKKEEEEPMKEVIKEPGKEKVFVNEKFNIKDLLL